MNTDSTEQETGRFPLIGPQDPPPFSIVNPEGTAKTILVCDHASCAFPAGMNRLGLDDSVLDQHVVYDIGAGTLARRLSEHLDAPLVIAGYSRLIVDLNRQLDDQSAFPQISDGIIIPGNRHLSEENIALRAKSFYQPYHDAVEASLDRIRSRDITPALIAVHSFTPRMGGFQRPWHIGLLWDVDPRIAIPLMEKLRSSPGIRVGDNEPYSGRHPADYTMDHHGEAAGIPHASIEVRQNLIDSDAKAERWAGILADPLQEILADPDLYTIFR